MFIEVEGVDSCLLLQDGAAKDHTGLDMGGGGGIGLLPVSLSEVTRGETKAVGWNAFRCPWFDPETKARSKHRNETKR